MFHRSHRHNHNVPVGVMLVKLALSVGGALLKDKLLGKLTPKPPTTAEKANRRDSHHNGPDHGSGSPVAA